MSEWRDQSDCTCSSGATTKYSEPAPPGMCSRIAVGARRQLDRRKEQEGAAANPDRRIGIVLHDRRRTLDRCPKRISVERLCSRHRRTGRIIEFDRRRHRQSSARPVRGRQRMHFRRHVADRQRFVQWRQERAWPAGGLGRIDFRGRRGGLHRRDREARSNCVVGTVSKVVSGNSTPGAGGGGACAMSFFFCRADRFNELKPVSPAPKP